jgi:hypothetical protein
MLKDFSQFVGGGGGRKPSKTILYTQGKIPITKVIIFLLMAEET